MFEDIVLTWGLAKCATVDIVQGKIKSNTENANDHYKFLGKYENSIQLEEQVRDEASKEYLKRVSVIWTSNISIPRKVHATKVFALPSLQYHMWTSDWTINQLKEIDRRTREIIRKEGGMHYNESVKLLKMAQREYRRRHDWLGKRVLWEVSSKLGFETKEKWNNAQKVRRKIDGTGYQMCQWRIAENCDLKLCKDLKKSS
ncbi:hypothetical protein AC249_AIPGENE10323 [Exaiptasia diaphana]|nr:hypothetical protein AC249_AIPGENE10323 [Exaiptasia diaphana]